jgi:hypothetical protein
MYLSSKRSFVIPGEAVRLVESGRNVDAEAQAVLKSLSDDFSTLQGLQNARDTIAWRLEASAHELATVLDERSATQRALERVDQQLSQFDEDEEDVVGDDWVGSGGEYGGEYDDENDDDDANEVVDELDA